MDIKERFYANLDVIREQMGSPPVSARPVMNRPTPIRPSGPPTRPVMSRPMDNKSFVDRSSSPQDVAQKAKQKAASFGGLNWQERSALGVDMQEAEQLDELGDTWKAWRKAWKRKKKLQKLKWRALDRYYKTNDTKKRDMHMKTFKKAYLKLPIGMDEEAEQLDEIFGSTLGNYLVKNTKQRKKIQAKFNAGKASRDEFRKGLRRVEGSKNAIKKLTGQAKVPAK